LTNFATKNVKKVYQSNFCPKIKVQTQEIFARIGTYDR